MNLQKRVIILILSCILITSFAFAMMGCGEKKTIMTPEGKITVEEEGGKISTEEGEYSWSGQAPTEAQLGVPIYPGAKYVEGTGGSWSATSAEGTGQVVSATFTTDDSFEKVISFYKDKLSGGEYYTFEQEGRKNGQFVVRETNVITTVNVFEDTSHGGKVSITISKIGGSNI